MSNHIKIDEDFVKSLIQDAAWDKVHVSVQEADETVEIEEAEEAEEAEKVEEAEEPFCPLCESQLDEELSDETILEHIDKIQNLLTEKKDVDEQDEEEEVEEDSEVEDTNKSKIKEKVKELKEKWSGQKKGDDNGDDDENGDPKAFGGKKGDKSKTKKGKDFAKKA